MSSGRTLGPGDLSVAHSSAAPDLWIYRATGRVLDTDTRDRLWPMAPPSRRFTGAPDLPVPDFGGPDATRRLGRGIGGGPAHRKLLNQVNLAITVARPLIITGRPGTGKSALAYSVARELGLGRVLRWNLTSRSSVRAGLYEYDSVGHTVSVQAKDNRSVGDFVRLGPLGTALLPYGKPRVLLLDGLDRADFVFPSDLLPLIDDGGFEIPELVRVRDREPEIPVRADDPGARVFISDGAVQCHAFPLIIATSEGERDLPPAFLRRCIRMEMPVPTVEDLRSIVHAHYPDEAGQFVDELVDRFEKLRANEGAADTSRLLDAVHVFRSSDQLAADPTRWAEVLHGLWRDHPERA